MALTQLTKIDGRGISTTSDYRVGILTAIKFVGPFDGTGGNFAGVLTATDGVFSGNVTIGGTLTYEDVTNIDAVGLITARNGIDCNGDIDVDGHTNLDNVSIAGVTTVAGDVVIADSIVHDGDTDTAIRFPAADTIRFEVGNQQAVHILPTSAGSGGARMGLGINNPTGMLHIYGANPPVRIQNSNDSANLQFGMWDTANIMFQASNRTFKFATETTNDITFFTGGLAGSYERLRITSGGTVNIGGNYSHTGSKLQVTGNSTFTGNIDANGDLDVDGHTNLDNVSIAGITTFSSGMFIPDNQVIHLGNVAGTGDLQIYHDTNHSYVKDVGTGDLVLQTQGGHVMIKYGSDTMALFQPSNKAELYFANSPKLATTNIGITVTGQGVFSSAITASTYIQGTSSNGGLKFYSDSSASKGVILNTDDHLVPSHDSNSDLGLTGTRWRNLYADTLYGDGSNLTGIVSDKIFEGNTEVETVDTGSNGHIKFTTEGTERLRINNTGEVGIGTNNPQHQFDLFDIQASSSGTAPVLNIRNGYAGIPNQSNALKSEIRISHRNHNSAHDFMATRIIAETSDNYMQRTYLRFLVANANNGTERLTINPYGNIGINTNNPYSALEIQGDAGVNDARITFTRHGSPPNDGIIGHNFYRIGTDSVAGFGAYRESAMDDAYFKFHTQPTGGSFAERLRITSTGSVNIGGDYSQTTYKLKVTGSFAATTKSFVIDHPTKENHSLRYACLEGPENSVYVRGKTSKSVIELPDYWKGLVHEDSITVNLTPIGNHKVWVEAINNNSVTIGSDGSEYFYTVFAERKDVDKLEVEVAK